MVLHSWWHRDEARHSRNLQRPQWNEAFWHESSNDTTLKCGRDTWNFSSTVKSTRPTFTIQCYSSLPSKKKCRLVDLPQISIFFYARWLCDDAPSSLCNLLSATASNFVHDFFFLYELLQKFVTDNFQEQSFSRANVFPWERIYLLWSFHKA